ncbi:MAG: hypothetical protein QOF58_104, partial [Pseudonocardiales bacterium]|nr:hypothetical protein [Pseudonocardiales bacterium]
MMKLNRVAVATALALGTVSVAPAQAATGSFAVSVTGGTLVGEVVWNPRTATVDAVLTGQRQDR